MTVDGTGPVLDLERLDAAADDALAGVGLDLSAVRARAAVEQRRTGRVRWALVAAAAAVLLIAAAAVSGAGALRSAPQPAAVPPGPGALPERIYAVPRLVTPVDRAPISRVAAVLQTSLDRPVGWHAENMTSVVLVGADGGQYRRLPGGIEVDAVSVSADGRVVAWMEGRAEPSLLADAPPQAWATVARVRWIDVATGRGGSTDFGYPAERRPVVSRTTLSPDGRILDVQVSVLVNQSDASARTVDMWAVITTTGRRELGCNACVGDTVFVDRQGRRFVDAAGGFLPRRDRFPDTLPPVDGIGAPHGSYLVSRQVFVSPDGSHRLVVDKGNRGESGRPDAFRLVEVDAAGKVVSTTDLGTLTDAGLLAWSGRTAWVSTVAPGDPQPLPRVRRVTWGTGAQGSQELMRPAAGAQEPGGPYVVAVTADVAAGGLVAATPAPSGDPWWSAESLHLFAVQNFVVIVLVVLFVGLPLLAHLARRRGRPRRLAQPSPWSRPAEPPSWLDRQAQAAAEDSYFGALDMRARPTPREDAERVFDDGDGRSTRPGGRSAAGADGSTDGAEGTDGSDSADGTDGSAR